MRARQVILIAAAALLSSGLAISRCGSTSTKKTIACAEVGDGVSGGAASIVIIVDDDGFRPRQVTAQDKAKVTLTLKNEGTRPHGFAVDCVPTPNSDSCPSQSCFLDNATIPPIPPGGSATITVVAPDLERPYPIRSTARGDTMTGQFNVN
jgi:hypothetical protein